MNTIILLICKVLDVILNWLILALFVYEAYLGAKSWITLSGFKKRINNLNEPKSCGSLEMILSNAIY